MAVAVEGAGRGSEGQDGVRPGGDAYGGHVVIIMDGEFVLGTGAQ
ncbi:MAG: hypothetical protein JWO89_1921 [Verrucomicrobiaceae bacterium]|nr:hypothetical protein [Verrucomicrobiaceae bacterium]